ncbi:MAG: hypothetical protein HY736_27800 [Verrucomicrobia bacterium]|nr:hypothetical protein [Verrucomicrobiota bacterium]
MASPALSPAQVVTNGTFAVSAGGTLLDGDRPAFQQRFRQKKDGFGGLENFTLSRTTDDSLLRFEVRIVPGDEDYRLSARWEKFDACYVQANYQQFRTFYDGSGGIFLPRNLSFSYFDEALTLDRSYFSFEFGTLVPNRVQWRLRYDRNTRDGTKNSLRWGESNLAGQPFVPRAYSPSYLVVDEERDIVTADAGERTDNANWKVAGRYERTRVDNRHTARRRPQERQDRYVTTVDGATTELFSGHGFYERIFSENLRASAGGLVTTIDTNVTGSKIYGATPDSEYSATFAARQPQDVGYYGLAGGTRLKQYLGNLNVVYQPAKYWTVRPGVRYEHLRQDSGEGHFDTDFGGGAAARAFIDQIEADSRNSWNEFTADLEVRYSRWSDWILDARGVWNQGTGNLVEQSVLLPNRSPVIDRDTDYERMGQRYTVNATWYARPGLTLGAQYNYRLKLADDRNLRDNTSNATRSDDRYPGFIIDNDLETHDGNVRVAWRPMSMLSFVTRYAHQKSTVTTTMDRLEEIRNGRLTRHVITQTATWNPTARLFLTGGLNLTYDQLAVPGNRFTMNSDNNYINASLGAGYAAGKVTDVYVDLNHYRADNYVDNPAETLPLNAGQKVESGFLTWVRRQGDRLIYTARYGYANSRDGTFAGLNDFDAHLFYGKVQYKF